MRASSCSTSSRSSTSTASEEPELPGGAELLRQDNAARVLRSLRWSGPATRADLAKRTGLAKATVGAIVAELEPALTVEDRPAATSGRGRPGHLVGLRRGAVVGLGLEVNVDYVAAALLDLSGDVLRVRARAIGSGESAGDPGGALRDLARDMVGDLGPEQQVAGVTLAVPGLVGRDDRSVSWAPNLAWRGDELARRLEGTLRDAGRAGLTGRVEVVNDANCAALAERAHGAARDVDDFVYLTGTVGIGAGLVQGGRLVRGGSGFAGEVGHMPLGRPSVRCGCGRTGCWETAIGLRAMLAAVGAEELATPVLSARAVARRAGEADVRRALEQLGAQLGVGLATLTSVLDPAVVVLGGYFVPLGESVLGPARRVLGEMLTPADRRPPELRVSALDVHAAATGAAERSLEAVLDGLVPLPVAP